MEQTTTLSDRPFSAGKLVGGVVLLLVGTLIFFDVIDFWEPRELWRFWPLLLIVFGIGHEIDTLRTRTGGGGFVTIGIGVWMLAGSLELFGLNYATGFPLGIMVVGLGMVTHALLGVQSSEKNDEQQ